MVFGNRTYIINILYCIKINMNSFSFSTNQELIAKIGTVACEYDYLVIHSSFEI